MCKEIEREKGDCNTEFPRILKQTSETLHKALVMTGWREGSCNIDLAHYSLAQESLVHVCVCVGGGGCRWRCVCMWVCVSVSRCTQTNLSQCSSDGIPVYLN